MAGIDILNIQPSVVSRDLKGKYVLIYSQPKVGKTSFAAQFPQNLLLACEKGYNALGGVRAADITKWSDIKLICRQLDTDAAKAMYHTVTIDTVSIAWDLCAQFICAQHGVQNLTDIEWGKGYVELTKEFENTLRKITMMGYGLVLIAHADERKIKDNDDNVTTFYSPALDKRCYPVCNRIVDVIGYIGVEWDEQGNSSRWLYTRQTPTIQAGSRFKYMPPRIPFGYKELVNAIADSIEMSQKQDGITVVDTAETTSMAEEYNYADLRAKAQDLWKRLTTTPDGNVDEDTAHRVMKRIEMVFGHPMKLSEITEDQCDLYNLVILDMQDIAQELNR